MSDEHAPPGPSYTLREASGILGVSVTALRRRVAAGQISAERQERPQGSVWRVFLDAHAPGDDRSVRVAERGSERGSNDEVGLPHRARPEPGTAELVALVGELSQKLAESSAVAAMWQERAGTLADRLAASESKLLALKAPQSPLEGSGATIASDPTTESLWTRWRAVTPPWLLTLLAIVVVVMLLGWPR